MIRKLFFLWLILELMGACGEKETTKPSDFPEMENGQMMLVCSEGNFRWGNAEAGLVNLRTGKSEWKAFSRKNNRPLGDVLQSAAFWDGLLWLVVNNSGRLEGLDVADFSLKKTITGFTSPRFLYPVSAEKAYVSDLYASGISILKKGENKPSGKIEVPGWTEEMLLSKGRIWVVCREQEYLLGIDPINDRVSDTLFLPGKARSICAGPNGKIWISFEEGMESPPGVFLQDPDSSSAEKFWFFENFGPVPDRLSASISGDSLFFICGVPCRIKTAETSVFRYPIGNGNWYGLTWDAKRKSIWASDALDYQQASRIVEFDYEGKLLQELKGGFISSRFYFW
jgi:hypothetical protein